MSPHVPSFTRRSVLSSLGLGAASVTGLAAVGDGSDTMTKLGGGSTRTASSQGSRSSLDRKGFRDYVDRMADRYGDAGVFGVGTPTYENFVVAHADSFGESVDHGDAFDGEFDVDAAVATYRVASSDDETRYRHLLWTAAVARDLTYVADPFHVLTKRLRPDYLRVEVHASEGRVENPSVTGITDDAGTVAVPLGTGSADFRHPAGRVSDRPTLAGTGLQLGRGGRYGLEWRGLADGSQSVATAVETVHAGTDFDVEWSTEFGFGYRSLL